MVNYVSRELVKDLRTATEDLHQVNPLTGLLRFGIIGFIFLSLVALAWSADRELVFLSFSVLAGLFYAFWLICTHDTVHYTLTGWKWFEDLAARLISWPMLWSYGVYSELHHLHHGWNGIELRDPERVQWTWEEYQQANPIGRWYVRHQWVLDIFVLGGLGLIVKSFVNGLRFQQFLPRLRRQLLLDVTGIAIVQSILIILVILQGEILRYLLFWLILERTIGIVAQMRDHLEHYGLWGKAEGYQITQLYASRNLKTSWLVGWLMGGLNYHAVHHAFPGIPFEKLPEAFERIQQVLRDCGLPPMELGRGYIGETIFLAHQPSAIGNANPEDPRNRNLMIAV